MKESAQPLGNGTETGPDSHLGLLVLAGVDSSVIEAAVSNPSGLAGGWNSYEQEIPKVQPPTI